MRERLDIGEDVLRMIPDPGDPVPWLLRDHLDVGQLVQLGKIRLERRRKMLEADLEATQEILRVIGSVK